MPNKTISIIERLSTDGVVHRDEVKNDLVVVERLILHSMVRRVCRNKKVFYELTEKALPILESRRKALLEEITILARLHKPPSIFHALLDDARFVDENHKLAGKFKFLGDWQIKRPVVASQLELAKLRYYEDQKKVA